MIQRYSPSLLLHLFILFSWLSSVLYAFTPTSSHSNSYYLNNRYIINTKNSIEQHVLNYDKKKSLQLNLSASASSSPSSSSLPDAQEMKASELRKELQSYGISTKSFFEKSELVEAVEKARVEGKTPIADSGSSSSGYDGDEKKKSTFSSSMSREDKLAKEIDSCNKMKVGELKKELESYGISTKSFFEKSEFVKAVAEARVDGVKKSKSTGSTGSTRTTSRREEEEYDPSYRDVNMQKMDRRTLIGSSPVIDVRLG